MEGSYHVVPAARSALFAKSTIASWFAYIRLSSTSQPKHGCKWFVWLTASPQKHTLNGKRWAFPEVEDAQCVPVVFWWSWWRWRWCIGAQQDRSLGVGFALHYFVSKSRRFGTPFGCQILNFLAKVFALNKRWTCRLGPADMHFSMSSLAVLHISSSYCLIHFWFCDGKTVRLPTNVLSFRLQKCLPHIIRGAEKYHHVP